MKKNQLKFYLAATSILVLAGCSIQSSPNNSEAGFAGALRPLSNDERGADFDQLLAMFKDYYGPYSFKERTLSINIENLATGLKAKAMNAKSDEEYAGYVMQFAAALKDGHVQIAIENTSTGVSKYSVPIIITPIEGKAIVGDVTDDITKSFSIANGDQVLEIDGKDPFTYYLPIALKYRGLARPESEQHYIVYALNRPSYMTELIPTSNTVTIKIQKSDGSTNTVSIPWQQTKYNKDIDGLIPNKGPLHMSFPLADDLNSVSNNIKQMGSVTPFFLTPNVQTIFNFVKVTASDGARKRFGMADKDTPNIYAALYKYQGKTILLVRQPSYEPTDFSPDVYLKGYMALLSEYENLADVLVLDQTHNPGGSYCADFYNIFARDNDVQAAELLRADRKWINELEVSYVNSNPKPPAWEAATLATWGLNVEKAYDGGQTLSDPVPLFTGSFYAQKGPYRWSKPMLLLVDELAGSCGDMFPMIVKANKRAQIFGQRTMGLGGNVEEVGILNNSRIHVSLTRGMFYAYDPTRAPVDADFVENYGVVPDISYSHTVDDYRIGYLNYVKTFSDAAILQK